MTEQSIGEQLLTFYANEGWKLVRVSRKTKRCVDAEWQRHEVSEEDIAAWLGRGGNVGVQAGEVSGWICGVDPDCPEAVALAPRFLPHTPSIYKGDEHPSIFVYRSPGLEFKQFRDLDEEPMMDIKASADGAGHMFVVPPSIHPTKGAYAWTRGFNPAAIAETPATELRAIVGRLATAALIARLLPASGRHNFALALAGYMLRNGVSSEHVLQILLEAWRFKAAPRKGLRDLERIVADTEEKLRRGVPIKGGRTLAEMFPKLSSKIAKFLGWDRADERENYEGIKRVLPDFPTDAALHMPPGHELDERGVYRLSYKARGDGIEEVRDQIAHAPLVISARTSDIHDNTESATLLYRRGNEWKELAVSRTTIATAREITATAASGVPVNSNNASKVVGYLSEFESYNLDRLPHRRTAKQLGWLGDSGKDGFLAGGELIGGENLEFRGSDQGDEQIAAGFGQQGTHKEWYAAVEKLAAYPRVYLGIYGSLAPPVLAIVGAPNFIIDWSNPTSTGKTTTLKVAASCWGSSDERSPAKVLYSWDATRVWTERAAAVLNCLPLILDESKRARNQRAVAQTLYDIANGSGRGRGTPRGLARAGAWTTVLLSTGEAPVTSFTEDGGTRARAISLWGPPFGGADEATGKLVGTIRAAVDANYGHAGPMLVEHLIENRASWGEYRDEYRKLKADYAKVAGDDPVLGRLGEYFAALALTATLAEEAKAIPVFKDPIVKLWDVLRASGADADRAKVALEMVTSWMFSHQHEFYGRHREDQTAEAIPPSAGWAGRWEKGEDWESVMFLPDCLKKVLTKLDFPDPESIVRSWRDRGWLEVGNDRKRTTQKKKFLGSATWMVVIRRGAFDVDGESDVT
jgi:putative DNA primase/helicase